MRRMVVGVLLAVCAATTGAGDEPFSLLARDPLAASPPLVERVVPADNLADLPDADSDMPEDEDLEYMTYSCQPPWAFAATWLYLQRENANNGVILLNDADDSPLLDAADLDFDHQSGLELTARYSPDACKAYELRYLWLDDWVGASRTLNPLQLNIATNPNTGPLATTVFDTSYRSRFSSVEANTTRALGESTLLLGFRYALVDEDLQIHGTGGSAESLTHLATQNDLFGLQVGLAHDWQSPSGCWGVGGFVKTGVCLNEVAAGASFSESGNVLGQATDSTDGFAFLGEAGIDMTYRLRTNIALRLGYRLLLVDGVAMATEQLDRTTALLLPNPTLTAHDDATLFAHGLSAAVEITW